MSLTKEIAEELGPLWIPEIYRRKVRKQRTRSFDLALPQKENEVEIVHTLLGIQLRTGRRLIACPDLSTARYLRVFARIGCDDVAVPYDITKISSVADELESAWQTSLLILAKRTAKDSVQVKGRQRAAMVREMRKEIALSGAGDTMPEFDTETRQRKL